MNLPVNATENIWDAVLTKNNDVVPRKIAGEFFLVPIRGRIADMQEIFTLNPVAEYIWQEIDGLKNLSKIRDGVVARFDVEKEQADSDLRDFISELMQKELIIT